MSAMPVASLRSPIAPGGPEKDLTGLVEEAVRLLGKASRAHALYLHNNPTYIRALDLVRAGFTPLWTQLDELTLAVTESELQWEGRAIYAEQERSSDALPWLLYKDGLRELRILPGFEELEVEHFLDVLRKLRRATAQDDDAITMLWERDFSCLRYRFVEPSDAEAARAFLLGSNPGLSGGGATGQLSGGTADHQSATTGFVDLRDFDAAVHFLTGSEVSYLREALEREYALDLPSDVLDMLLDTLELESAPQTRAEVCVGLEMLLIQFLATARWGAVAHLLSEVDTVLSRVNGIDPAVVQRLNGLRGQLSSSDALAQLFDAFEVADPPPPAQELEAILGHLEPLALGHILLGIQRVESGPIKSALQAAADRLALANTTELVKLIKSDDSQVALEAVRRSGALKAAAAVSELSSLLGRASGELRIAAAHALAEIATPTALQLLSGLFDDDEREVRLAAYRSVAANRFRAALPKLEAVVKERRHRNIDLTERMAMFEAYGTICGEDGISFLDGLLNGRSLLGRRHDPPVRACAAVALGRINSPASAAILGRASDEREPVVRTAVQRALRGGAAR